MFKRSGPIRFGKREVNNAWLNRTNGLLKTTYFLFPQMSALLSTARGFGKRGRDDMSSLLSTARGFGKRGQMSSLLSTARGFGKRSAEVAPIVIPKTDRDAMQSDEGHNIGGGPNTNSGISFVNENIHYPGPS